MEKRVVMRSTFHQLPRLNSLRAGRNLVAAAAVEASPSKVGCGVCGNLEKKIATE